MTERPARPRASATAPWIGPEPPRGIDTSTSLLGGPYADRAAFADDLATRIADHRADYEVKAGPDAVATALLEIRNLADGFRFLLAWVSHLTP